MSNDKFTLSLGLAQQLEFAFGRNGWTSAHVHELSKGDVLAQVREFLFSNWVDEPLLEVFSIEKLRQFGFKRGVRHLWSLPPGGGKATLGNLVQLNENELRRLIGRGGVEKIKRVLESRGLRLGMNIPSRSRSAA